MSNRDTSIDPPNICFVGKQENLSAGLFHLFNSATRECSGSVVEGLTRDRGAAGSSLIGVTALWSLSKTHLS